MLVVGAVAGGEPDLRQGVVETGLFGDLRELTIVVDVPTGALFDGADHQATTDVGDPVGELDRGLAHGKAPW
ncbi:hypothetical protein D3C75_1266860 [compost metagenome]